ncbi:MAG: DUF1772 domain-containing protein [Planctomycetota bacterium]|nr:DUF1772 domain-containing protein [Planctomycetota bacterium]
MIALVIAAAVGSALVSGIFYAFSTFIMGALGRLRPSAGIAAMQSINVVVLNPLFFLAFFGTGIVAIALVVVSGFALGAILGGALYVLGCIGVTIAGNVPLNERLAKVDAEDPESEALWSHYLSRWTFWNSVRTAASLAAAVVYLVV